MNTDLQYWGITQNDLNFLLGAAQAAYAILTAGLFFNWTKTRHPGILLSAAVFGFGAYYSFNSNNWWPLGIAMGTGYVLKNIGFNMGYH